MDCIFKEVYFDQFCKCCAHKDEPDNVDPCDECLTSPMNIHSHKPINWESNGTEEKSNG